MTLLVIYLLIAIGVSFLCSVLEAVLLSVTHGYVEKELTHRPRRAKVLKEVKDDLDILKRLVAIEMNAFNKEMSI